MSKKIPLIGAGISGLSAGCYALMNGYDVEIHEAHSLPGGLCTGWKRQGYFIDGCIHWLTSSSPESKLYRVWEELGTVQDRPMFNHEIFSSYTARDGRTLHFYTDVDRLEQHMKDLAPADNKAIDDFCGTIRRLTNFDMAPGKPGELAGPVDGLLMMLSMGRYMKDFINIGNLTLIDLSQRFTDPLLRNGVANSMMVGDLPAMALMMTLSPMNRRAAGFPLGGSLAFAQAIEERFIHLGGKIHYRSRVGEVIEWDGHAIGVRLESGAEVLADAVISACDMRTTHTTLLGGRHPHPVHTHLLETSRLYPPAGLVNFGVDMDFSDDISCLGTMYELDEPIEIAGERRPVFGIKNYCYDPSFPPPGKSIVGTFLPSTWSYWEPLAKDPAAYAAEKERIAATCRNQIECRHPGFSARVEMTDVATPYTFNRYTGNWQGVYMTFQLSGEFQRTQRYIPMTVPGLDDFYMASMWTKAPGGLPGAAMAGREVVQLLCHAD
ncbi:MAG TPA: NAD(P)/FAD-dependent oxidoreductase, partial [Anaerolinea sp.]|nr:NAD(P)/FAD-dependent oxidoreductase [Anaerolinea sp.]